MDLNQLILFSAFIQRFCNIGGGLRPLNYLGSLIYHIFTTIFQGPLAGEHLLKIANEFPSDRMDILQLGYKLQLDYWEMDSIFQKYQSYTEATHAILRLWFTTQPDKTAAKSKLGEALVDSKHNQMARKVLDYPE